MTNTELLKDKIHESGLKYGYIADKLGISRTSLYLKVNIFKIALTSSFKRISKYLLDKRKPNKLSSPSKDTNNTLFKGTLLFNVVLTVKRIKVSKK